MQSGMIAVWDPDREYGEKLSKYLRRQAGLDSTVVSFGDVEKLRLAVDCGQVAMAVIGQQEGTGDFLSQIPGALDTFSIPIVILSQDPKYKSVDPVIEREKVSANKSAPSERRFYYKFQPAGRLLTLLLEMMERSTDESAVSAKSARIRGIYSPLGGCLKTSLGLVMGCLLAEDRRCLFLSLEAHSGFRTLFGRQYPVDLSDLFAQMRQGGELLGLLAEAVQPFGKLQYVPPVIWPVDVREAEFSELQKLLQNLALCGRFDEIILDVGQDLACPEKVLQLCDEIYQPEKEDIFSQGKLAEYEAYLRITGQESLCERTRHIPLSRLTVGADGLPLDQWQRWEQMIPVVRQILQETDHEG